MTTIGHAANGDRVDNSLHLPDGAFGKHSSYSNVLNGSGSDSASTLSQNGQPRSEDSYIANGQNINGLGSTVTSIENGEKIKNGVREHDVAGNGDHRVTRRLDEYDLDFS